MTRSYPMELVCDDAHPFTDFDFDFTWRIMVGGLPTKLTYSTDRVISPAEALEKLLYEVVEEMRR
jgi:hypothetical protein